MSIEIQRQMAMEAIRATKIWKACWPIWEPEVLKRSDDLSNPAKVFELGSQLREIFLLTNTGTRDQSGVSGAGSAWECLVCWYLNLVFAGTNAVAMRQSRKVVPSALMEATTITYGNYQTNTESDLCVIVYPDGFEFPAEEKNYLDNLNIEILKRLGEIELGIIQCKTNWNENAQIPMLWDMVYHSNFESKSRIKIGRNGRSTQNLKKFSYAFVTVPTQKTQFKPTQMPVKRTSNLSGGNYWGKTSSDAALSVSEIFMNNFQSAFGRKQIQESISRSIESNHELFIRP